MSAKQQKKIDDFEVRYKGIEISEIHEELESYKSRLYAE